MASSALKTKIKNHAQIVFAESLCVKELQLALDLSSTFNVSS